MADQPEDRRGNAREVPEAMRIEDSEAWFRYNALRSNSGPTLDQQEDAARFAQQRDYQNSVMADLFAEAKAEEEERKSQRNRQLEELRDGTIVFETMHGKTEEYPLYDFAESCDTVFALATSWEYEHSDKKKVNCKLVDHPMDAMVKFAKCVMGFISVEQLDPDSVVECCLIADYLQNYEIRDKTEEILKSSIDTSNCLSICHLADRLGMSHLFELSLQRMMTTLGEIDEGSDCWEEMGADLRERVLVIKAAIQSSVHSQRSKLYFHSLEEYISIFAEKVQYYRERLAEAKDQAHGLPRNSHLWLDTQHKISKQEQRVKTLSAALKEQKKLFSSRSKHALPQVERTREAS